MKKRNSTEMKRRMEGRWLAAALRGGGLRIFDLPAARCVDAFAFVFFKWLGVNFVKELCLQAEMRLYGPDEVCVRETHDYDQSKGE